MDPALQQILDPLVGTVVVREEFSYLMFSGSMLGPGLKNKLKGFGAPIKKKFMEGKKAKLICV